MQQVYTARDSMEAHFVKGLLEQEGIEAVVQGEALQEAWGALPLGEESLPGVWVVNDADVARVQPIIVEYRRRDQADAVAGVDATEVSRDARAKWKCPQCGELVEEQFTNCWHCGHARPAAGAGDTALA